MSGWAWPHPSPYILLNGLGLIVGLFLLDRSLKRHVPWAADRLYCLFVLVLPFAWLGAHTLDVLANHRSFATAGFVFYGGLMSGGGLFALIGAWLLSARTVLIAANAAVVPIVVAHTLGRMGCFMAGCCFGRSIQGCPLFERHPTQLYEAGFLGLLGLGLMLQERRHPESYGFASNRARPRSSDRTAAGDVNGTTRAIGRRSVSVLPVYLILYPTFRFFIEFLRDDQRGGVWGMSTSQILSIVIVVAVAACGFVARLLRPL